MTSSAPYLIRPYEAADRDRLRELAIRLWPDRDAIFERRWWWWLRPEAPLLVVESRDTGQLVGMSGYLPFSLYHQGRQFTSAWFVDLFVLPAHQRHGLGRRMTQAVMQRFEVTAGLQGSAAAWAVLGKLGWRPVTPVPRYVYPFAIVPGARRLLARAGLPRGPVTCDVQPLTEPGVFDAAFDGLWERCRDALSPLAVRDADALRARYLSNPDRPYILARCVRSGELVGYTVLRLCGRNTIGPMPWVRAGLIVDMLVDPADTEAVTALIRTAKRYLVGRRAQVIVSRAGSPVLHRRLVSAGFAHAGTPVIGRALRRLTRGLSFVTTSDTSLPHDGRWYLTLGDSDTELGWVEPRG